jgi:hypothetical protein
MTPSQMRKGHSYTVTFAYARGPSMITGEMRAEFVGKTNEGAFAFSIDRDHPYLALPAEWIRHVDPAERRAGHTIRTSFGRQLTVDEIRDQEAAAGATAQMAEPWEDRELAP